MKIKDTAPAAFVVWGSDIKDLATLRSALSGETNAAAAGGRIINPPYPAADESDGIYELVDSGLVVFFRFA